MKKEDLKTGMTVTYRSGEKGVVFRNTGNGHGDVICNLADGCYLSLSSINDDLTVRFSKDYDIIQVDIYPEITSLLRSVFKNSLLEKYSKVPKPNTLFIRDEEKMKLQGVIENLQKQLAETQNKLSEM